MLLDTSPQHKFFCGLTVFEHCHPRNIPRISRSPQATSLEVKLAANASQQRIPSRQLTVACDSCLTWPNCLPACTNLHLENRACSPHLPRHLASLGLRTHGPLICQRWVRFLPSVRDPGATQPPTSPVALGKPPEQSMPRSSRL